MKICVSYDRCPIRFLPSIPKKCRVRIALTIHPPYDTPLFEGKPKKRGTQKRLFSPFKNRSGRMIPGHLIQHPRQRWGIRRPDHYACPYSSDSKTGWGFTAFFIAPAVFLPSPPRPDSRCWSECIWSFVSAPTRGTCLFLEDRNGYRYELRYIRDKEGREVDFAVLKEGVLEELIEARVAGEEISGSLPKKALHP
jgi:hypothetical protein